jgi:hypothetical protein
MGSSPAYIKAAEGKADNVVVAVSSIEKISAPRASAEQSTRDHLAKKYCGRRNMTASGCYYS